MVVAFNTETLNGLCSNDQLKLLDAIDNLRLQGIDHYISLPQIIVCGDQSSGKSSVLEAISGVPFPVQSNLCTRFPTELVLRRSSETGVTVSIIPEDGLVTPAQDGLHEFHQGFEGFPSLVEKAKLAMGISTSGKAFSKDRLRVEISGPDRPHLTIIDMPGLIHSETKSQSAADVELVRQVVKKYMEERRSIILAVVSAKNDFANQVVLNLAQKVDKRGSRTMGVITKPDTLVRGSGSEQQFISLAENKQVHFDLGWHVLRNLDSETQKGSSLLSNRNAEETRFFSQGVWNTLSTSMLGIAELRKRLSDVLLQQIALELPSLIREIDQKLDDSRRQLKKLGEPRLTLEEQRLQLLQISQTLQSVVERSVNGTYNDSFFKDAETPEGYQQRIRAVIQALNKEFAEEIGTHGHRREIRSKTSVASVSPEYITRDKYLDHVQIIMQRTRGRELPGIYNSMAISDLFHQQSSPWELIARKHVDKACEAVEKFLRIAISHVADPFIGASLLDKVFRPAVAKLRETAQSKTTELLDSHRRLHPITYNREYEETIHKICCGKREQIEAIVKSNLCVESISTDNLLSMYSNYNLQRLVDELAEATKHDVGRSAASEALDRMLSYYSIAMKRFIDSIAMEVIERQILVPLSEILSPVAVFKMSPQLVDCVAGESQKSRKERKELMKKIEILQAGLSTCKQFASLRLEDESSSNAEETEAANAEETEAANAEETEVHTDSVNSAETHPETYANIDPSNRDTFWEFSSLPTPKKNKKRHIMMKKKMKKAYMGLEGMAQENSERV